jgi:hypothetical protein
MRGVSPRLPRFREAIALFAIALALAAAFRAARAEAPTKIALLNVSYDPTRELYEQVAVEQGLYDRLEDKLARELISEETFKRHRAESEERMDALRRKIAKLTDNRVITQIPRNIRAVWPGLSLDRKRAILAAVIRRIEVHPQGQGFRFDPEKIKVVWKA